MNVSSTEYKKKRIPDEHEFIGLFSPPGGSFEIE
jgi:hypothetical protein